MLAATEACGIGNGGDLAEVDKRLTSGCASGEYPNSTLGESHEIASQWITPMVVQGTLSLTGWQLNQYPPGQPTLTPLRRGG